MNAQQTAYPMTPEPQPLRSMLLLFGFIVMGMALGTALATLLVKAGSMLTGGALPSLVDLVKNPAASPNGWWWIMGVQVVYHVSIFLLPTLLYWFIIDRRTLADFNNRATDQVTGWGLVVLLTIAFMPVNGLFIELNQALKLPESLAPLERWMQLQEDSRAVQTKFLTNFRSIPQLVMAVLTIAIIPAIGEEVLFRGVFQRKFIVWTGSVHAGIWLAAALFSAIHVQFYGFVPRLLLGALFGYLYVWSGNLWVPILAHFVNNGFTVLMIFLYQRQLTAIDVDSPESTSLPAALLGTLASVGALVFFKRMNGTKEMKNVQ